MPAISPLIRALRNVIANNGAQAGHDRTIAQLAFWRLENDPTMNPTSSAARRYTNAISAAITLSKCLSQVSKGSFYL
jgi:hypothetical protein